MLPKSISKLKSTGRLLPIMSGIGLLAISYLLISPVGTGGENASAWVYGDTGDGGSTTTASVSMVFDKDTVTNEQVDVVAGTPVASEAKYFTITPSGSVEKYSIYVQTSSSANGSLVASNANNNATIATLADKTTGVPLSSIGTNTWGYALSTGRQTTSSMLYKGLSGSTNAISAYDSSANPTTAQDFTLAFAANIGNDKPADHYIANVLVSVAANPGEVTSSWADYDIIYMQELTFKDCRVAPENTTGQLIDSRDNKTYWVTKLKDGNCWMTQNLDYDDPNSTKVSTPSSWTSTAATYRAYYDPGNYYYTTPSNWTQCSSNGTGLSACTSSGWSTSGDAHYHAGNYYSWAAATNNTSNSISSGNATDSICPAGWQLPTSNSTTDNGSFGKLVNGLNSSTLVKTPYYFIPGGGVWSGLLYYAGNNGYYWSSTANNSSNAYALYFSSSNVNPSNGLIRYFGLSVRCLVQGS